MSVKIGIIGIGGRMGQSIARCIYDNRVPGVELGAALERQGHPYLGRDVGDVCGIGPRGLAIAGHFENTARASDVLIDFSFHESTMHHARLASEMGCPMVVGTTGFTDEEKQVILDASAKIPMVIAPNMSLGVNLLFSLVEQAARALKDKGYDIEIIETHHNRKKDAPSGTALGIGEAAARGYEVSLDQVAVHGRAGLVGERRSGEIGFHAVRAGDVVGDHSVIFATDGEILELGHRATSRDTFAIGALRAAAWLAGKPSGLYSMKNVLGLA